MPQGNAGCIGDKVLLGDIGHILAVGVLGKEMVKGLVAAWPDIFGNGLIPFFGVVEFRIDIENYAAKSEYPVAYNLPDLKFCVAYLFHHHHSL